MRILILGGTQFLGRHLVDAARARGHEVTLFNRGVTNATLHPDLESLRGDRGGDLAALAGRRWDAAIDTCGYLPGVVRVSAERLADAVAHYTFVSSISVYADDTKAGLTEADAVRTLPPGTPEAVTGETYGALKALCEAELESRMPGRVLNVRAGLLVGPHDVTGRAKYWPVRMARGGEVLAPGRPERPVQFVDARDVAAWIVRSAEAKTPGVFNATGPAEPLTMSGLLDASRRVGGAETRLTWVDEAFLLERDVKPYSELPMWVPEAYQAYGAVDIRRALGKGLAFRPLEETLADTLAWARALPPGSLAPRPGVQIPPGLTAEREAELLAAWHDRAGAETAPTHD